MKNETKLNIIELVNKIIDLHDTYNQGLRDQLRGINNEAAQTIQSYEISKLFSVLTPVINELEDLLQCSFDATTVKQDKEELKQCIEFTKIFHMPSDERYMGQVQIRLNEFRSYIDGLVENYEQHRTTVEQSPAARSGKEKGTVGNKKN